MHLYVQRKKIAQNGPWRTLRKRLFQNPFSVALARAAFLYSAHNFSQEQKKPRGLPRPLRRLKKVIALCVRSTKFMSVWDRRKAMENELSYWLNKPYWRMRYERNRSLLKKLRELFEKIDDLDRFFVIVNYESVKYDQ